MLHEKHLISGAMTNISVFLGGSARTCMLILIFAFLVCEIVVGQICKSLLIAVDSYHTLYVSINMALSGSKHHPKSSITNPHLSSTCLSEPHKPLPHLSPDSSPPNTSLPADPGTLPEQEPYSRMRLKPFGILISALLLASQCISIGLEILTRLMQPEAIQYPLFSIVVGATSLLFNILMFSWRKCSRGMNDGMIQTDLHLTSERKNKDTALQDNALMFCNPAAPTVLHPDQSVQDHQITKPFPDLCHAEMSNSTMSERSQHVLQPTEELSEETKNTTSMDPTRPSHEHTPVVSRLKRLQNGCIRHLICMIQDLLGPSLILVNGLVLLLIKPHCHRPHSDCHLLVYLDASFSTLVVLVLLATALPKIYRYGLLVLQATPMHFCISQVQDSLACVPGVLSVHELHVWQLSETYVVASVHVHCQERLNAAECSDLMVKIMAVLSTFGINHCTVQPEFFASDGRTAAVSSDCSLRCGKVCDGKLCCSPQMDKSSFLQPVLSSVCLQKESSSSPGPLSVETTRDVIIENTFL